MSRDASSIRARLLPDGRRLHLQHGPIDLIVEAWGSESEVALAWQQARKRFEDILATLVGELDLLRRPIGRFRPRAAGPVAQRMIAAVWPFRAQYITPMAAVAGAVADEILAAMIAGRRLDKAYVNDGGDIALYLTQGQSLRAALIANADAPALDAFAAIDFDCGVRGIATSGWRGRSQSLGIADAVTVLAADGAAADAAATMVANAVDIDHPAIRRAPARSLRDDSDLGDLPVTVAVGTLPPALRTQALMRGAAAAEEFRRRGLIAGAALALQGDWRVVGDTRFARHSRNKEAG